MYMAPQWSAEAKFKRTMNISFKSALTYQIHHILLCLIIIVHGITREETARFAVNNFSVMDQSLEYPLAVTI